MVGEGLVGRDQCLVREWGNGGNRVRFQDVPEETSVVGVGVDVSGAAPKSEG